MNIILLFQVDIEEKLKNAPDNSYAVGVLIGELLPLVVLVGVGYYFYNRAKKRKNNQ